MKKAKLSLILVLALSWSQVPAQETIYNNFGQGHNGWDYNYGLGWTIAGDSIESQYGVGTGKTFSNHAITFSQNYPNPFSTKTNITYVLEYPVHTSIRIYNMLENELVNPVNEDQTNGEHRIEFDASSLPAGMYFCSIKAGKNPLVVIKMNCIK